MFERIPNDVINNFISYSDVETRTSLSMVDKRIRGVVLETIKKLIFGIPIDLTHLSEKEQILKNLFFHIISRYPNLEKLFFRQTRRPSDELLFFQNLTSQLTPHKFKSIESNINSETILTLISDINSEKITLVDHLESRNIECLKDCNALKEIFFVHLQQQLDLSFLQNRSWNLETLELEGFNPKNDKELIEVTRKLVNLICLNLGFNNITTRGIRSLKTNCPNLKILRLTKINLANFFIEYVSKTFPDLEVLAMVSWGTCINLDISRLAPSWKKLRYLGISNYWQFGAAEMCAVAENCPELRALSLNQNFTEPNFDSFLSEINKLSNLRYLEFPLKAITVAMNTFYTTYTQIQRLPHWKHRFAKELYELVKD